MKEEQKNKKNHSIREEKPRCSCLAKLKEEQEESLEAKAEEKKSGAALLCFAFIKKGARFFSPF